MLIALQNPQPAREARTWSRSDSSTGQHGAHSTSSDVQSDLNSGSQYSMILGNTATSWDNDLLSDDNFPLPPMAEMIPIVEHYFATFSAIVPLFDKASFMRMLGHWFADPSSRNKATWAAIQVVLAIALRTPVPGHLHGNGGSFRHQKANFFLRNAQSVVSELVTREQDLLGLQVLLGLALLFQNSSDSSPASVIIGTAIRLAHRMGLHSREHDKFHSSEENLQRQRLFWIAYTLDKAGRAPYALVASTNRKK